MVKSEEAGAAGFLRRECTTADRVCSCLAQLARLHFAVYRQPCVLFCLLLCWAGCRMCRGDWAL